jgi:hypothetical protein
MKEPQKFITKDEDGNVEYVIIVTEKKKGTEYSIFASDSNIWSEHIRNEKFMTMFDDGNGIKFSQTLKHLNYSEAEYVKILLSINNAMCLAPTPPHILVNVKESGPHYKIS